MWPMVNRPLVAPAQYCLNRQSFPKSGGFIEVNDGEIPGELTIELSGDDMNSHSYTSYMKKISEKT